MRQNTKMNRLMGVATAVFGLGVYSYLNPVKASTDPFSKQAKHIRKEVGSIWSRKYAKAYFNKTEKMLGDTVCDKAKKNIMISATDSASPFHKLLMSKIANSDYVKVVIGMDDIPQELRSDVETFSMLCSDKKSFSWYPIRPSFYLSLFANVDKTGDIIPGLYLIYDVQGNYNKDAYEDD